MEENENYVFIVSRVRDVEISRQALNAKPPDKTLPIDPMKDIQRSG